MKAILILIGIGLIFSVEGGAASPKNSADYESWENKPVEKFAQGEAVFAKVKEMLLRKYYQSGLSEDELYRAAVEGMLKEVDPRMAKWNQLLSPTEFQELQQDLRGQVVGAGVEIQFDSDSGVIQVVGVIPDSPAEAAGLKTGDTILRVNGKFYKGRHLRDVIYDIRGKAGETRSLTLLRGEKVLTKQLRLKPVHYENVATSLLPDKIGLVSIRHFSEGTAAEVRAALEGLRGKKVRALVLDLRGNGGGVFDKIVETTGMFLPKGATIVKVKKRDGATETLTASGDVPLIRVPLAVLVDKSTSCGAEILSAALRENLGALVIGARTLGKWSIQTLEELPNGFAVKFTVGTFESPKGVSYDGVGLEPDLAVGGEEGDVARLRGIAVPAERLAADRALRAGVSWLKDRAQGG